MAEYSLNFEFLTEHDPMFAQLGGLAERYFRDDPNTCLFKLRQLGEALAKHAAVLSGISIDDQPKFLDVIRRLDNRGGLNHTMRGILHNLRMTGNAAVHEQSGTHADALHHLKLARQLAVWFHRTFSMSNESFRAGPFVPPPDPAETEQALREELSALREELAAEQSQAEAAKSEAQQAAQQTEDAEIWAKLADELEDELIRKEAKLVVLQAELAKDPFEHHMDTLKRAYRVGCNIDLDEADTRRFIDQQLRLAGWEADSSRLTYKRGVRPQKGKNIAIAEWPTETGPSDYVLFAGLTPLAIVEAKRQNKDVAGAIEQAKRYSRGYTFTPDEAPPGGPWGDYRIPFLFSTNGRPYMRQLESQSGIWFLDARSSTNHPYALEGWYTPEGMLGLLGQDIEASNGLLEKEPTHYLGLRDYQLDAIRAVEGALAKGARECLLAMATGTGKTRTTLGLIYRLIKTKRFRRVLFLVDRSVLGVQAANTFATVQLESFQTFAQIFDMKVLSDVAPEPDTRLHLATIQGLVRRIMYSDDPANVPSVDQYDCIVVDESHRGYNLDQEMSDVELGFRDQRDYISKYRRVLDHFDAVKIALTATPAVHTAEIFGAPVYRYTYRRAVIDGWLVDHEPPLRIVTKLARDGIHFDVGAEVLTLDPTNNKIEVEKLEDEVDIAIDGFNKRVITEPFNRAVCSVLVQHIDPTLEEKTLVFCATDRHADMVVRLLKEAFTELYGEVEDNAVVKITGTSDKPLELIRRYRNERNPNVAVTVDLLSTGVDIPKIANIVFLRRVRSRILYEQMLGRATRLCDEIHKERFRIFDAVDIYSDLQPFTEMKPVVANPTISFEQLATELVTRKDDAERELVFDQLMAKLQRKKARLKGEALEHFEAAAELNPSELLESLKAMTPIQAAGWFESHAKVALLLDRFTGGDNKLMVSDEDDAVVEVAHGYGEGNQRPEDFISAFDDFVRNNLNAIPALLVVTQRPRDLTRKELKSLKLALDEHGFSETQLRTAWRDMTNQEIAASIIGFIRRAALGDALTPYEKRVERALSEILSSRSWTPIQRKWLERIGKQLIKETVVDREALDRGQFQTYGGFARLNKIFGGQLEQILGELSDGLWAQAQ